MGDFSQLLTDPLLFSLLIVAHEAILACEAAEWEKDFPLVEGGRVFFFSLSLGCCWAASGRDFFLPLLSRTPTLGQGSILRLTRPFVFGLSSLFIFSFLSPHVLLALSLTLLLACGGARGGLVRRRFLSYIYLSFSLYMRKNKSNEQSNCCSVKSVVTRFSIIKGCETLKTLNNIIIIILK